MRNVWLFIVCVLVLVACNPGVDTATPVPTVPSPTPVVDEPFQPVNQYPNVSEAPMQFLDIQKGVNNPRRIVIPAHMDFVNNMLIVRPNGDEDCGWLPPYVYARPDGLLVEPEWLCGEWALGESVMLQPGRHILKMGYYNIRLRPSEGEYWENGNVQMFPTLYTATGNSYYFAHQNVPQRGDGDEFIWVIEVNQPMLVRIEWTWRIEWPSVVGSFVVDQLRVETAPPDFGNDVVVGVG